MGILDFLSGTPSRKKFGNLYIATARKLGIQKNLEFHEAEFLVRAGDDGTIYLENAYRDYCAAPKGDRDALLQRYLAMLQQQPLPKTFAEARANLMPIVRGRAMEEMTRLTFLINGDKDSSTLSAKFSADTVLLLAYDDPDSLRILSQDNLRDWNVTFDVARQAALDNLRDRTEDRFQEFVPGIFMGNWNDSYDTSRILLSDVIFRAHVGANPVVMIPTRGALLVTSTANAEAQLAMIEIALNRYEEEGRIISSRMYRFENGTAVEYIPEDERVRTKLGRLERIYLAEDYATQKQLLEQHHEKNDVDVFVATCTLMQTKAGDAFSICSWAECDSSLPVTDAIAFAFEHPTTRANTVRPVAWNVVRENFGDMMVEETGYPPRFRVEKFPPISKIESLPEQHF